MRLSVLLATACLMASRSIGLCREILQDPPAATSLNSLPEAIFGGAYLSALGPSQAEAAPSPSPANGQAPPAPFVSSLGEAASLTPNGNLSVFTDDPGLKSDPGDGIAQAILTLGPCADDIPHNHPRGAETSFIITGRLQFGMVQEDAKGNNLLFYNVSTNQSVHIPQGIMHFAQNPNCYPAAFVASFDSTDPGIQTVWASFARIPTHILNGATGFSEQLIDQLEGYPLVSQPGTGGEECLKRCGLNFQQENKLTPLPQIIP